MCDDHSIDDMLDHLRRSEVSRRRFASLTMGAGLTLALPRAANAAEVQEHEVTITTPDGNADAYFVHPAKGKVPGVIVWPDAMGLRPVFKLMGKRLAEAGYAVLVPNPFYRTAKAPVFPANASFNDPAVREQIMKTMQSLNPTTHVTDAKAFVPWLDKQAAVDGKRKMGTTGYCMGGAITMRTAGAFPDRVGAGASFHGAMLANDRPDSPHLLVPKMKAQFLIAIAENDDKQRPDEKNVLRQAFDAAKLPAEIEVYAGAQHGWCPPDSAVYNEAQAEKAWTRMLVLFKRALV